MAKRYKQNMSGRMAGGNAAERMFGGFDSSTGIMGQNASEMANMPRDTMCTPFQELATNGYNMDDTMRRMDNQVRKDISEVKKNVSMPYENK